MVAHNSTAPHRGDADFTALPAPPDTLPAADQLRLAREGVRRGLCQHEGRPTGGIHLLVVVPLHDFDVTAPAQHRCGPAYQLDEDVYAKGQVGGAKDRDGTGSLLYLLQLSLS